MHLCLSHPFHFDPTHGTTLDALMAVRAPDGPADFAGFWQKRARRARRLDPQPSLRQSPLTHPDWQVLEIAYRSTDDFPIRGWLLLPRGGPVTRGLVVGHGYGGREGLEFDWPVEETAILFPCFRGLSLSARAPISQDPAWHVLHDIDRRDDYIIGGCIEDVWLAVSALVQLYPWLSGHIGYAGTSFGGGIGAFGIAFDERIDRGFLSVPTFGHQTLWRSLPSIGSAASVRDFVGRHPETAETLRYFDAATAAGLIEVPMLVAAALFDPVVAPPCQFAVFNALRKCQEIFILDAGHFDYPGQEAQEVLLRARQRSFFQAPWTENIIAGTVTG